MSGFLIDGLLVFATGVLSLGGLVTIIWYGMSKMEDLLR